MAEHHILVIDDDERLRVLLRRFLEESGFRVTDAASANEARRILRGMAFDILVVDVMMQWMMLVCWVWSRSRSGTDAMRGAVHLVVV